MPVAPSFADLLLVGQAEAQARRPDLVFADGDITEAQLHGAAAMTDAGIRFSAQAFRDTFLDGARGDALTALVDDHLNIQRKEASQSQVIVSWSRTTSGPGGTIPNGSTVATVFDATGETVEFTTDSDFIVGAGLNGPFLIACTAVLAGRTGNVAAGAITRLIDQPAFDPNFSITNTAGAAGGNDEESDEDLRTRAREFFLTLRRGTIAALEFGAKRVLTVAIAKAIEDTTTGITTVRVSDSDGGSTQQMINDVLTELEDWRCAGSLVNVEGGNRVEVSMSITITAKRDGFSVEQAESQMEEAIIARAAKLRSGETLFLDTVKGAVTAVFPDDVLALTIDTIVVDGVPLLPVQDVVPVGAGVIRVTGVAVG